MPFNTRTLNRRLSSLLPFHKPPPPTPTTTPTTSPLPAELIHQILHHLLPQIFYIDLHKPKRLRTFFTQILALASVSTGLFREVYLRLEDHCLWLFRVRHKLDVSPSSDASEFSSHPLASGSQRSLSGAVDPHPPTKSSILSEVCVSCRLHELKPAESQRRHDLVKVFWRRLTKMYESGFGERRGDDGVRRNVLGCPVGGKDIVDVEGVKVKEVKWVRGAHGEGWMAVKEGEDEGRVEALRRGQSVREVGRLIRFVDGRDEGGVEEVDGVVKYPEGREKELVVRNPDEG